MSGRGSFVLGLFLGLVAGAGVVLFLWKSGSPGGKRPAPAAGSIAEPRAGAAPRPSQAPEVRAAYREADSLRRQVRHLRDEAQGLRERLHAIAAAQDGGIDPVAAEARALRAEVAKLRGALQVETQVRESQEGKPVPFPKDLPDRYRQEAMVKAVTEALRAAGAPGEVKSVDCNEYPCIVYGELQAQGPTAMDAAMRKAEENLQKTYPPDRNRYSTSLWSSRGKAGETKPGYFGISIFPHPEEGAGTSLDELRKRMRFRQSQYTDTLGSK